ncbi:MAG: ATP-binding protein, partial [Propionibacteriaceae bacterium]|nr:ATP-binding protein [Propionibacteriaceae bacterium]
MPNPFKPTAGAIPPRLAGRSDMLDEFAESLDDGPGAPARLSRFTGARGVGKTVMLAEIRDIVLQRGWVSLSETATPGLVERLSDSVTREIGRLGTSAPARKRIQGITLPSVLGVGGGGLEFSPEPKPTIELRQLLTTLVDVLESNETGLLVTIDEIHRSALDGLRTITTVYQHLVTEGRNVALAFAGLPSAVSDLLSDNVLTFLRRA